MKKLIIINNWVVVVIYCLRFQTFNRLRQHGKLGYQTYYWNIIACIKRPKVCQTAIANLWTRPVVPTLSVDLNAAEECLLQQLCRHQSLYHYEIWSWQLPNLSQNQQRIKGHNLRQVVSKTIIKRCFLGETLFLFFAESHTE